LQAVDGTRSFRIGHQGTSKSRKTARNEPTLHPHKKGMHLNPLIFRRIKFVGPSKNKLRIKFVAFRIKSWLMKFMNWIERFCIIAILLLYHSEKQGLWTSASWPNNGSFSGKSHPTRQHGTIQKCQPDSPGKCWSIQEGIWQIMIDNFKGYAAPSDN
jgi:hypothetical protein